MKKKLFPAILIFCVLLSGCKKNNADDVSESSSETENSITSEVSDDAENSITSANSDVIEFSSKMEHSISKENSDDTSKGSVSENSNTAEISTLTENSKKAETITPIKSNFSSSTTTIKSQNTQSSSSTAPTTVKTTTVSSATGSDIATHKDNGQPLVTIIGKMVNGELVVNVNILNNPGCCGYSFGLSYDKNVLELLGATDGDRIMTKSDRPMFSQYLTDSPYYIVCLGDGDVDYTASGSLATYRFKVNGEKGQITTLSIAEVDMANISLKPVNISPPEPLKFTI